jgi:two-component system chemotaxis response regulator CheY
MALDVLIVDDSATIRKILQRVVAQAGLDLGDVSEAADGAEALAAIEAGRSGLVLCDINMPNMDGLQLLRAVQGRPDLDFIMITTEGNHDKVMEAIQLGAKGYVRKPFTAEEVREQIVACAQASSTPS